MTSQTDKAVTLSMGDKAVTLTLWLARNHRCDTPTLYPRSASEAEATPLLELARGALRRRRDPCPRMLQHHLGD